MLSSQPIVVWSLEGALLRRDNSHAHLLCAARAWMGRGDAKFEAALGDQAPFREQTDNEVVRSVFYRSGIDAQDWMIQGALAYHERCLSSHLACGASLATPGIERALTNLANDGIQQLVISWHTEKATHIKLSSARIARYFEVLRCAEPTPESSAQSSLESSSTDRAGLNESVHPAGDPLQSHHSSKGTVGRTGLSGIFSGDSGSFEGVLHALKRWACDSPLVFITASPREIFEATRLGIHCIGVTSGGVPSTELSMAGAAMVITERTGLERINKILPSFHAGSLSWPQSSHAQDAYAPLQLGSRAAVERVDASDSLASDPNHPVFLSGPGVNAAKVAHGQPTFTTIDLSRAGRERVN